VMIGSVESLSSCGKRETPPCRLGHLFAVRGLNAWIWTRYMQHIDRPVAPQVPPLTGHRHSSHSLRKKHPRNLSIQFIHFHSFAQAFFFSVCSFISAPSFRHPRWPLSPPRLHPPSPPPRLASQGLCFLPSSAICFHLLCLRPSIFILVSRSLGLSRFVPPPPAASAAAPAAAPLLPPFLRHLPSAACPSPLCSAGACSCSHLRALTDGRSVHRFRLAVSICLFAFAPFALFL
jgi:hypothetical protein